MAGGFFIGDHLSSPVSVGQATATSTAVTVTCGAANTKGSYLQLTASTTADATGIMIYQNSAAGTSNYYALDIAVGGSGSEQIIISNVLIGCTPGTCAHTPIFPITIPAGTRLSARGQCPTASDVQCVAVTMFDNGNIGRSGGIIDSIGLVTTTTLGTLVDAGATANTKSAYVQITAATTADYCGFTFHLDSQNQTDAANNNCLLDVAVGASGSEQVILSNYMIRHNTGGYLLPAWGPWIEMDIRTGTRIAIRMQCSSTTSTDRTAGFTFYGLRG